MIGKVFGRLTVIQAGEKIKGRDTWLCKCECGNEVTVYGKNLRNGTTKSCGCLRLDWISETKYVHGESGGKYVGERTRLYRCWVNMKSRCYNKNVRSYSDYGAKGIKVCAEWLEFANFADWAHSHGYSDDLTIERKNPHKDYCPENCEWITGSENSKRAHRKMCWGKNLVTGEYVEFLGIRDFAAERGLSYSCIDRVLHGRNKTHKDWIFGYVEGHTNDVQTETQTTIPQGSTMAV